MQVKLTSRITIEASPKEVFEYLYNPRRHHLWNPHLVAISTEEPLKQGTTYQTTSVLMGVTLNNMNTVAKLVRNKSIEICNNGAAFDSCAQFFLEPAPNGTIVKCVTEVDMTSKAFSFTRPVLRLLAKRELQSDLRALKLAVEQKLR